MPTTSNSRFASVAWLVSTLVLLTAGCGGSDSGTDPGGSTGLDVTLSPAADTLWIGQSQTFSVSAQDSDGNQLAADALAWMSSDPLVAEVVVDDSVFVRGVGAGSATITALIEGRSGSAEVIVRVLQFSSVDAGTFSTCGLIDDGAVMCWGANGNDALLGVGAPPDRCPGFSAASTSSLCNMTPAAVLGSTALVSLSRGNGYACGLDAAGAAYCWGVNNDGRLGTGDTISAVSPEPVTGGLTFMALDAGGAHACGLTTDGAAFCWGSNENDALGGAASADTCETLFAPRTEIPCSTTPLPVGGGLTFTAIDVAEAGQHTCALTADGTAYCWGRGRQGQLGSGDATGNPRAVPGVPSFTSLALGSDHSCGLTAGGEAYCWGGNVNGQVGNGTSLGQDIASPPGPVSGGIEFASLSGGAFYTCGVDTDGAGHCWGKNHTGQLGSAMANSMVPVPVFGSHTFASIEASWFHTCGLTTDDIAFCWGANEFGQLGTGTTVNRGTPARVVGQP